MNARNSRRRSPSRPLLPLCCVIAFSGAASAQLGTVQSADEISGSQNGRFGAAIAWLGDLDGDGDGDLAVGASSDDDGGSNQGAVWVLFLNPGGTVDSSQKISALQGGFGGDLDPDDSFGWSVASLGDLDGDGITDIAVGTPFDDDGGTSRGALWILFLNADGTVKAEQKINATAGGFGGVLDNSDSFGRSVALLGDIDGDDVVDIVVGASGDSDTQSGAGALWILHLDSDGTVKSEQKINELSGGFGGDLLTGDEFGSSVAALGDIDGNGVLDIGVGATSGGFNPPEIWILLMSSDETVGAEVRIAKGFPHFGSSIAPLGDLDGNGVIDIVVGSPEDEDGGPDKKAEGCENPWWMGSIWVMFLRADGTLLAEQKISETEGGLGNVLDCRGFFGSALAFAGDLGGDGDPEMFVGAPGNNQLWKLSLEGAPCATLDFDTEDDSLTALVNGQHVNTEFGTRVTITASGANAGAGIFDTTPGGPNDPGVDPDLLVDTGNVLILQAENLPPDPDDIFPVPDDDDDGGALSFVFSVLIQPRSLRLVDIDAAGGSNQVVLTDSSDRERTYTVPADWTGDRELAQPGQRTLDLTTVAPQAGFNAAATATEDAGFDSDAVIRIDVVLDGSGGVDDLAWCRGGSADEHASATVRNGTGVNPLILSNHTMPVLGGAWVTRLDCAAHSPGVAGFFVRALPVTATIQYGQVLVGGPLYLQRSRAHAGSVVDFAEDVPFDLSLVGLTASSQGACTGGGVSLSNAIDIVVGY